MLRSEFSRKAHANFKNYFLYAMCFFQHIDVKSTSISLKIEDHIKSNFHFSVSIDIFNHLNATNIKYKIILGVKITPPHISSLMQVNIRYPIL